MEPGPLHGFATDLRALRRAAGSPPYRRLERAARFSASTLADAASGKRLPTREVTLAYVRACGGDEAEWSERWSRLSAVLRSTHPGLVADESAQPEPPMSRPPGPEAEAVAEAVAENEAEADDSSDHAGDGAAAVQPLSRGEPRKVGPFRLLGRLGGGAMGEVYLAASPAGRPAAVKLVRPELARDPLFRRRFARELRAVRTVRGGHTPDVIAADPDAERPWMATQYVPGPSLGAAVEADGPLPEPAVLGLAAGIAEALETIHAAGIVHRDLKPSNILLAADGPKVIDFGICRALDGSALTATGVFTGATGYTAPELAVHGKADAAADVFSLGAVLAYAATGVAPFGEGNSSDVLYRVVHERPAPESLACRDRELRRLIERCLDKDPSARPSPAEIVEACGSGENTLPAALASLVATRREDTAQLLAKARRARNVRRAGIGLAPLILILATATVAAAISRPPTVTLQTVPPERASAAPIPEPSADGPATQADPTASDSTSPTPSASDSPSSVPQEVFTTETETANPALAPGAPREAPQRTAPRQLKNPDFNGYCQATGQGPVQLVADNAYGWHCSSDNGTGDDAQAVCAWTNGTTQLTNRIADFNDPTSWQCWASAGELGPIDWNAYCRDLGYSGATDAGTNTVYTWYCNGSSAGLDAQDACLRLYGESPPVSRFQDYYDKNSWQCWG